MDTLMMMKDSQLEAAYRAARELYGEFGVDTDLALERLAEIPVSMHCWQGDDVVGFEKNGASGASGGILSTGNYPGRARNPEELRADLETAFHLLPGKLRLNLHAVYLESPDSVGRDEIGAEHFRNWIGWARKQKIGLDFNPTFFSHPMASGGLTLSSPDPGVRSYWIAHAQACRGIAEEMGRSLGTRCIMNTWIPDGFKDIPVDRRAARERLAESLDEIYSVRRDPALMRDAVESKLFGIGVESCTVGSHEFYLGYALKNGLMLCLDSGHFHPTEQISDKISSVLLFLDEILLHVSRPVRWDSDHVVLFDDELQMIASEIVRNGVSRVNIGLDYFDATINRIAAWVVGVRNMQKALCKALLEPSSTLREAEEAGDYTRRLVLTEELKALPWQAVYHYFCLKHSVPAGFDWMEDVLRYESQVFSRRQ